MKIGRVRAAIKLLGRIVLLGVTFLLGVLATALLASVLELVTAPPPPPPAVTETAAAETAPAPLAEILAAGRQQELAWSESLDLACDGRFGVEPLALADGRTLVARGATLYMLDDENKVVWKWSGEELGCPRITDQPVVDDEGNVHVIGLDMTHFALDAATGRVKWGGMTPGRAFYSQIEKYTGGRYIILTDTSGCDGTGQPPSENTLQIYRGQTIEVDIGFPRAAKVLVRGEKIYALIETDDGIEMREIDPVERFYCAC